MLDLGQSAFRKNWRDATVIPDLFLLHVYWLRSLILVSLFDNQSLCTNAYTWMCCAASLGNTPSKAEAEKRTQVQVVYWIRDSMMQERTKRESKTTKEEKPR